MAKLTSLQPSVRGTKS